jgi:hypothetical protein
MGTIGGGVKAILTEVATLLERLASGGEPGAIDLQSLPMNPAERAQLLEALGSGEVTITLRADGESTMRETGVSGVWWSEYRDRGGELIAAFIEIARVPAIVPVETDELRRGVAQLRSGIAAPAQASGN